MRQFIKMVLVLVIAVAPGCKKSKDKDYAGLMKNTVWTGEINIRGGVEPYAISFKGDGSLEWYEAYEDFTGTYTVDNPKKEIRITLTGTRSATITATIADDKLTAFNYGATYAWTLTSAALNKTTEQALDNTTWKGSFNPSGDIEINFKWGLLLNGKFAGKDVTNIAYTRKSGCVRFTIQSGSPSNPFLYFGVLSNNNIKGMQRWIGVASATWSATKQ